MVRSCHKSSDFRQMNELAAQKRRELEQSNESLFVQLLFLEQFQRNCQTIILLRGLESGVQPLIPHSPKHFPPDCTPSPTGKELVNSIARPLGDMVASGSHDKAYLSDSDISVAGTDTDGGRC